jgi:hypothetical protein
MHLGWNLQSEGELTGLDIKTNARLKEYFVKVHDFACTERIRFPVKKGVKILTK